MSEELITRREWESLVKQLESIASATVEQAKITHSIEKSIGILIERDDSRIREVEVVRNTANDALQLAQLNRIRITTLEASNNNNTKALDGWQANIVKIITGFILLGAGAYIGALFK